MPFKSIKGAFRVVGLSPDGDSVRFFPDDPSLVHALPGGPREPRPRPSAQLRLEAIDALETHYAARHQPLGLAHRARDRLLEFIGIRNVRWNTTQTTVVAADDGTRGHILTRQKDKYGRPVAFLFAGDTPDPDGADVFLDADRLAASYNHFALAEGLAYPTYYEGLFADLRNRLTAEVRAARAAQRGLWAEDATTAGFDATSLAVIMDEVPILPKLFRRLSDYMATNGTAVGFREALGEGDDAVWDLRTQNRTHLDSFVEQAAGTTAIRLTRDPEELVFDPMPARPGNFFAALIGAPISGDPESLPA
ncbi:thermonuclease family protein [Rhodoplanes azumiensis]|uniref:Thermonuclease family protein n=1 Tax=Rhodoplanes azumiensis TaxID=1897628 RepID=A0ABW5AKY7_9BRAD